MPVHLEFYVSPGGEKPDLGRFMGDLVAAARKAEPRSRERLWHWVVERLPELSRMEPDALRSRLLTQEVWLWLGSLPIYRTPGEPCVFFAVVRYRNSDEVRIYALGVASSLNGPKTEAEWKERLTARCRSLLLWS